MANIKFNNACNRVAQAVPPVWMMRQAGRYHQHYQQLRKQYGFMELCQKPSLAAEVALGPVEDFDFDVSILFSDLLFPLQALGMGLSYDPAPKLGWHLDSLEDFKKFRSFDDAINDLLFQGDAVAATRKVLPSDKSLIGFVGSPWTLFVYAVAGSHKGTLTEVKKRMGLFPAFCEVMGPLLEKNIKNQLNNGAEVVMVFDTAAGDLSSHDFKNAVEPFLMRLSKKFPNQLGYYSKNTLHNHVEGLLAGSDFAGFGFDHRWILPELFNSSKGFVQGNFDQNMLFLPADEFEAYLRSFLVPFQKMSPEQRLGWVCGLGHGVLPKTPEANVRNFVKIVREVMSS